MTRRSKRAVDLPPTPREHALPATWLWVRLSDVAVILMGNSPPGSSYNTIERGVPLINGPTEFEPGPLDNPRTIQFTDSPSRFCEPGDLLVCVRGSTTGRTNVASFRAAIGRGIAAVRAAECQPFVNYFVASQANRLLSLGTGSTFPSITVRVLASLSVPLPPLAEQHRIIESLRDLTAEIDAGTEALLRAQAHLHPYQTSILRGAVDGTLTVHWRTDNPVPQSTAVAVEDVGVRAARSRGRRGHSSASQLQLAFSQSSQNSKHSPPLETAALPTLPESWRWVRMEQVGDIRVGRQRSPKHHTGAHMRPYLRVANVFEDRIDTSDVLWMNFTPSEAKTYTLEYGDILLNEGQSLELVGRPAMFRGEVAGACFQNTLIRFRAKSSVLPEYALIVFRAYLHTQRFQYIAKRTTNIAHLSAGRFAQMAFPLPPIAEQKQIVQKVTDGLSHMEASRQAVDAGLARSRLLRQHVLQEAFAGRLVNQDATDEPASILLKRISLRRDSDPVSDTKASLRAARYKGTRTMHSLHKRSLLDVLKEHPKGITPDELLRSAGYDINEIDDFYVALRSIASKVKEKRPARKAVRRWPMNANISLRLEGRGHAHR